MFLYRLILRTKFYKFFNKIISCPVPEKLNNPKPFPKSLVLSNFVIITLLALCIEPIKKDINIAKEKLEDELRVTEIKQDIHNEEILKNIEDDGKQQ